ncbi:MAG: hypothetical protein JOZ77_06525 [Candidatus Eremiobacteraeota bacterium]|nr:hypothetical protein [Candidatus Eremiobacteraeota bacterium]
MSQRVRPAHVAALGAFVLAALLSHFRPTPYNNFVLLAQAMLHGHVWIDWPGSYIDALRYGAHYYVIEAPLPAILLLPFVAIFGGQTNQTLLAIVLCAVAVGAAWELGERLGLRRQANAWICGFFLAGTDLLWCSIFGDVWFIAHVAAVAFTMLALVEMTGRRRGWLVALLAACAVESRFSMIAAIPVYAYLLIAPGAAEVRTANAGRAASFAAVLSGVAVLWLLYNHARWGTWSDLGYITWYHQDQAGMPSGSPFRLTYLPYQLWSFFVQTPTPVASFPWLRPEYSGVALTWTSPALVLAFLARRPVRWVVALWAAVLLAATPNLLYYVNGFAQFGMRHALDFEPFLIALMMFAVRDRFPQWGKALVAYSIIVGIWGCWYWLTFVRS